MSTCTPTTPRLDPFTPIHKALRRILFETAMTRGRTDFASADETDAARQAVAACFGFLHEHAEHEDRHVVPLVATLSPDLAEVLASEHPDLQHGAMVVTSIWPRLERFDRAGRLALGAELTRRFHLLTAAPLRHMDREEREVCALLWDHLSDAEIGAISTRIVAEIAPQRMADWRAIIGAAMSRPEREAQEARLRA